MNVDMPHSNSSSPRHLHTSPEATAFHSSGPSHVGSPRCWSALGTLVLALGLAATTGCEVEEGSGGACDSFSTCTGGDVCINDVCVPAFPRVYSLFLSSATVAQLDPATGEAWDPFDGAPDPIADVYVNDDLVFTSSEVADTLQPTWNEVSNPVTLRSGDSISIYVYDSDVDEADFIGGCVVDPVTAETIRDVDLSCSDAFGSIEWSVVEP